MLVPSRQRAAAVRLAYAGAMLRSGARSWPTPQVLTPSAWLRQQRMAARQAGSDLPRLLEPAAEWLLWRDAAARLAQRHGALLSTDTLANSLRSAAMLTAEYDISAVQLAALARFDLETSWTLEAMRDVELAAAALNAIAEHQLLRAAPPHPERVALGSVGLQPLPRGWARVLHHATALDAPAAAPITTGATDVRTICTASVDEELRCAAQWCHQRLNGDPQARLLVIVPDLDARRYSVRRIWRDTLCPDEAPDSDVLHTLFALEGGEALTAYPWLTQLLDVLQLLTRPVPVAQYCSSLLRPFWPAQSAGLRARLSIELRRLYFQQCDLQDVLQLLQSDALKAESSAATLHAALQRSRQVLQGARRLPGAWAEAFAQALEISACGAAVVATPLQQQLQVRWQELLEECAGAGSTSSALSATEAVDLLVQLAQQSRFAPATGDAAVTITALETHPVVSYDGIWVCGRTAARWPAPATAESFLPHALQLQSEVRVASAAGQLAIASDALRAWRQCTEELRLSWSSFVDDARTEPSALLHGFTSCTAVVPAEDALQRLRANSVLPDVFDDDAGAIWPQDRTVPGGSRSLELQSACAFRAFAELRLHATPWDLAQPGLDRRQRGQLLHRALELFWRTTQSQTALLGLTPAALTARIDDSVEQAAAWCQRQPRVLDGASVRDWQREQQRTGRQMERLCDLERHRPPFLVRATEQRLSATLAGAALRLRIDRIDELDDGTLVLLDYKASDVPRDSEWFKTRPAPVQLLVYLAALSAGHIVGNTEIVALATLHLGRKSPAFHGVADNTQRLPGVRRVPGERSWRGPNAEPGWLEQRALWIAIVNSLASDFLSGRARPDPQHESTCTYCALSSLCRRVERVRYDVDSDDDGDGDGDGDQDASAGGDGEDAL